MNNSARFKILKKKVGGNREIVSFEHTMEMSKERQMHITPPNKNITKVLSEIEFSLKLDKELDGKYEKNIASAIDILEKSLDTEGVITFSACDSAEEELLALSDKAKEYKVILCGHGHIDMNWMWGWDETVSSTLATMRSVINLMEEYPDFTYSQSQASVYKIIEEYDFNLKEQIMKRIQEGRWEVTAGAWVENDKNMPHGEALIKTVEEARDYLEKYWDIKKSDVEIDFSPDTFGHSAFVPEINTYSGLKYCYHCRGKIVEDFLYRYKAPSGAEIIMYQEPYWYNSGITPHIGIGMVEASRRMSGLKTGMVVYGVGNHGGGATRKDIENALDMMEWPVFPTIKFGTYKEFFSEAEKLRDRLPVVDEEINFVCNGCYTSQADIKRANRMCEAGILEAERVGTFASVFSDYQYNNKAMKKAWRNILFNHFHDILPGSCTPDSKSYAMGLYQTAKSYYDTEENLALTALSKNIDVSMVKSDDAEEIESLSETAGAGFGSVNYCGIPNPESGRGITRLFNIINTTSSDRDDICEITIWDWPGDISLLTVEDVDGNPVEFSVVDWDYKDYWSHKFNRILVKKHIKAYGYTTIVVKETELLEYPFHLYSRGNAPTKVNLYKNDVVLENEHIRAEFDQKTMSLISLIDKSDNSEKIKHGEFAGLVSIRTQSESDAWRIGSYTDIVPISDINDIRYESFGDLKNSIIYNAKIGDSRLVVTISLEKESRAVSYNIYVDWDAEEKVNYLMKENRINPLWDRNVRGKAPLFAFMLPIAYTVNEYMRDVPMGIAFTGNENQDIPANSYVTAICDSGKPIYVATDSTYGYRCFENTIIASLVHSGQYPDKHSGRGLYDFTLRIGVGENNPKFMSNEIEKFINPLRYLPTNIHKGYLKPEGVFADISTNTSVITSISKTDNNKILVRINELEGKNDNVKINFGIKIKNARIVDLLESYEKEIKLEDDLICLEIEPFKILGVEIEI